MAWALNAIVVVTFLGVAFAQQSTPFVEHSPDHYVTYIQGDLPLIITVPHGGTMKPSSIPDRHNGCEINGQCVFNHVCTPRTRRCRGLTSKDSSTREIAELVWTKVNEITGKRPHLVINELHRSKMDANREVHLATFDNPEALDAFGNYTLFIHKARTLIGLQQEGHGLFVEIHGQSHSEGWTELGYTLSRTTLNSDDFTTDTSSIRALGERTCDDDAVCKVQLISGDDSLGALLQNAGYNTVPSPANPSPGSGSYYSGGHNTKTYGSRECGDTDAIQVEIPRHIRFGDYEPYANTLGSVLVDFMEMHDYN